MLSEFILTYLSQIIFGHDLVVHQHLEEDWPGALQFEAHNVIAYSFYALHFIDKAPPRRPNLLG